MKGLLILVTPLLVCAELLAQTTSTSILGTVTDATGAAVSGVKVTATNVGTNVQSVTLTTGRRWPGSSGKLSGGSDPIESGCQTL